MARFLTPGRAMIYLRRSHDAQEYHESSDVAEATLAAMCTRRCDECRADVQWSTRTILMHGSTIDHGTLYLDVFCPACLPTIAARLAPVARVSAPPRLPCGCPLDSGCDSRHESAYGLADTR